MLCRDFRNARHDLSGQEEKEGGSVARAAGGGTDQSRIFIAVRGGKGGNVGDESERARSEPEEVMKEHLRNESCFRQHYSLARNLSYIDVRIRR